MKRRAFLGHSLAVGGLLLTPGARARAAYPDKPVRLVVAVPAGGSIDMVARVMAQHLSESLGQSFIVENKGGGSGMIGTNIVARAPADGYTLGVAPAAFIATNTALFSTLPYDPTRDFAPISKLIDQTMVLAVRSTSEFATVEEVIERARKRPGELTFGSGGQGSPHHLSGVLFANKTGAPLAHVPYQGGGPAIADLLGGHIDMVFAGLPEVISNVRAGKMRALALLSAERSPLLPEVPTLREKGYEGVQLSAWMGLIAPAGTPRDVVERLNESVVAVLRGPAKERLSEIGLETSPSTPEEFAELIRQDIRAHGELLRAAGVQRQ